MRLSWGRTVDALFVLGVVVTAIAEIWVPLDSRQGDGRPIVSTTQVLVVAGALWWRRTQPVPVAAVVAAGLIIPSALPPAYLLFSGQFVPLCIATFSVARHATGRGPWIGAGVIAATLLYADLFIPLMGGTTEILYHWGVLTVCFAVGRWQAVMADRAERSRQQAIAAEIAAAEAVLAERTRIARELHDIVAHAMSVMVVQAGAAEQLTEDDPVRVRKSLSAIRSTGTEALGEMRRLVGMLRDDSDVGLLAPQPGLSGLKALVDEASETGLPVTLEVSGDERDLPAGVDLAAYRIVQEALTNARRHAVGASQVSVAIRFEPERLELEVADDGRASADTTGSGHGLVGMRERVALYDGTLAAEQLADGGFRVLARLPLAPVQGMAL
ncbi:MAG: sensor histidine kinase [Actinomycetales bacterium]|nr:sensor histidine kinase [Actinomycetales bacterium]